MKTPRDPNRPRITVDAEDVAAAGSPSLVDALGDKLAESAWPGVFSGGKQIVATQHTTATEGRPAVLTFMFNDGTQMTVVGDFEVRYKLGEGAQEFTEESLKQAGKELMSGKEES